MLHESKRLEKQFAQNQALETSLPAGAIGQGLYQGVGHNFQNVNEFEIYDWGQAPSYP